MKGDFTRGFQPDQSRGKRYRRVLLQQGRVLLDSDHAALVDATDRSLRELAVDLGCAAGSPDYGYVLTPGVLRRLFDSLVGVSTDANTTARLDYEHRYLDRFPSLYLEGSGASSGVVTIELIPNAGDPEPLVVWIRSEVATSVGVKRPIDGVFDPLATSSSSFERVVLGFGETDTIEIHLDPGERLWIGMIETDSSAAEPSFSIAAGRYYLGGLVLDNSSIAAWPEQAFVTPTGTPFLPLSPLIGGATTHVLAYVEGWERLHTQHHDPGLREEALGGELDTTVRSEVVGQVKIATLDPLAPIPSWDALAAGFAAPLRGDGELTVDVAAEIVDPDPCAVPVDGGYTGRDNRLYRFEVHAADGSLATTLLKWSRDNGSELFPIVSLTGAEVTVAATSDLRDGDLVEVLSEVIELGDQLDAQVVDASLTPSKRMVGELAVLVEQEGDSLGRRVFRLGQVDAPALSIALPAARYGDAGADATLLRRWHGLIDGGEGPTHEIEDGIGVTLGGSSFEVGSWWIYEARTLQQNANGEWQSSPHGPERRFAPLAIFELPATVNDPLELHGWADDRFSSLCSTNADDIPYDGDGVCSEADTVQEALDELFRKTGCCEVKFSPCHPSQIPDDQLIAELVQRELPNGGVLCLAAGVYTFAGTLDIAGLGLGGELTIRGCPGTIIQAAGSDPLVAISDAATLTLEQMILVNLDGGTSMQVHLIGDGSRLLARDVAFVVAATGGAAIADDQPTIITPSPAALLSPSTWPTPPSPPSVGVDVELRECTILAGQGLRFDVLNRLLIDRCNIRSRSAAVSSTWIRDARITDSRLSDALNPGADIPSVSALVSHPRDALAIAADMSSVGAGVALTAVTILTAHIAGNRINAATGSFVDGLWLGELLDNHLRTGARGLLINQLHTSRIAGNRIVGNQDGVLINFSARVSSLTDNHIFAQGGAGIELCALLQGEELALEHVEVCANEVFASTHAIHVGPTTATSGECVDVLISGNIIDAYSSGPSPAVRLSRFASELETVGLSFIANHLRWTGSTCMRVRGAGVVVGENRILQEGGKATIIAVASAPDAIIRGNLIELINATGEDTVGIEVIDSSSVVIRDNHVHQPGQPVSVRPLLLDSIGHAADVSGNRLTNGHSIVGKGGELRFVGNRLLGSVEIKDFNGGEVSGNYAEGTFDFDDEHTPAFIDSILIFEADGEWRVCDNKCPNGALRLIPLAPDDNEVGYRAVVTDNAVRTLQVGWLGDIDSPKQPTNVFEQTMKMRSFETRVIVTENLVADRLVINDYFEGSIRTHNIANEYFANFSAAPVFNVDQPNVEA